MPKKGRLNLEDKDREGTKKGFDIALIKKINEKISKPVIACGGMGKISDFFEAILEGKADAVSFAHVLHYNKINIADIRTQAKKFNLKLREYEIS